MQDKMFATSESTDTNFWRWVSYELKNWEPMKMGTAICARKLIMDRILMSSRTPHIIILTTVIDITTIQIQQQHMDTSCVC